MILQCFRLHIFERCGVACPASVCTNKVFDGENYTFKVAGFSNYTVEEETNLNIWDQTDALTKWANQSIIFYANFTNLTSGNPIAGAGVYCDIKFDTGSGYGAAGNMTYANNIWNYTGSFSTTGTFTFFAKCDGRSEAYHLLNTTDSFTVSAGTPIPEFSVMGLVLAVVLGLIAIISITRNKYGRAF